MKELIARHIRESIEAKTKLLENDIDKIEKAGRKMAECLRKGKKVLFFGNGGSASDSQHLAAELVGRFDKERPSLKGIALNTNNSTLTAIANDYGYESVFSRQMEGLGDPGDVAVGLSTSGKSPNVIQAVKTAKKKGIFTIALIGKEGGLLKKEADLSIIIQSSSTARIQESHILIIHCWCKIIDSIFSSSEG